METQQYPHKIKREEKTTKQESITTTRSSSSSSSSSSSNSSSSSSSSSTKQQLATINSTPPSASSSPTHEFSFTISVHPPSATTVPDKTKAATGTPPTSFAIDLSPADDIFFHGHLLPLHLLSHLPISPRSSTNSLDSFSLPIKNTALDDSNNKPSSKSTSINNNIVDNNITSNTNVHNNTSHRRSTKSAKYAFPLFGLARWRKACEVVQKENKEEDETKPKRKKKKVRLNVAHILRRYIRLVRPLLVFRRKDHRPLRRQPYSFSGNLMWKGKQELKGRREHSAPASMWTSPTNSGLLVATTTLHTAKSDSTMEELQSAIQAAIAHCKNSIAVKEEKLKC
ncbi:hypothetical protein Scep_020315 [Stephania cephalantha]|uniref:BRI1 kinase inhibitor 1 n=1 Tax=Stephania cephalantha TaxID=152367 RepID=A0AAP0NQQ0_9MAGN